MQTKLPVNIKFRLFYDPVHEIFHIGELRAGYDSFDADEKRRVCGREFDPRKQRVLVHPPQTKNFYYPDDNLIYEDPQRAARVVVRLNQQEDDTWKPKN